MGQLFGEDMGVLAAALETLEMEDAGDEEELAFDTGTGGKSLYHFG